jgi:hypothetical protein
VPPRPAALAIALALPACAAAPPPAPVVEVPPPASASAIAPPPAPEPPAPVPSAHVDATGCALEGPTADHVALAWGPGEGTLFGALATPSPVRVVIAEGRAPSSVVASVFGLAFDAVLPTNGVRLHARAPLGLAGVYDPAAGVPLHWSTMPRLHVEVHQDRVRVFAPLAKDVACAEVGLGAVGYADRALPPVRAHAEAKRALELSPNAGAPPAAELPKDTVVRVHGRSGAFAEVSYEEAGLWHGFAPTADLAPSKEYGTGWGTGRGRVADRALPGLVCPSALALFVRRELTPDPLARVGEVRAGMHVALEPEGAGRYRRLTDEQRRRTTESGRLDVRKGFELVVETEAARACTPDDERTPGAGP